MSFVEIAAPETSFCTVALVLIGIVAQLPAVVLPPFVPSDCWFTKRACGCVLAAGAVTLVQSVQAPLLYCVVTPAGST